MTERPIIFNDAMSLAIIEGRKTVTRRPVLPMPGLQSKWLTQDLITRSPSLRMATLAADLGSKLGAQMEHPGGGPLGWVRSPYSPGDKLWVRECFAVASMSMHGSGPVVPGAPHLRATIDYRATHVHGRPARWTPSIHMPRAYSRTTLDVLDVRVGRLQDITDEDARAEGVDGLESSHPNAPARMNFATLWDGVYPAMRWSTNPWVWVIEFKR